MFHLYNIFILISILFTYSLSNDTQKYYPNRTMVSSRTIYELVQIRRAAARFAAYRNRTQRYNYTNSLRNIAQTYLIKSDTYPSKPQMKDSKMIHHEFLFERLKIVIISSSIAIIFMIILVIICIFVRYQREKQPPSTTDVDQRKLLKPAGYTYQMKKNDTRNFSRKPRTLPTAV